MFDNELFNLKSENVTLLQSMQLCLDKEELEDLNILLYEYAEICLASRANPQLNNLVYDVKIQFKRMS